MASGCIIGTCKYCDDHVWEDENYDINMANGMFHIECKNKHPKINKLAELGKLAQQTELCYWGYQYNDGDCNEEKYPCVRNELCKMKAEVCK